MVSGDAVHLDVAVMDKSALLLKTQGSTKVYKRNSSAAGAIVDDGSVPTSQIINGRLGCDSVLLSLPDPITCFADSSLQQLQTYRLTDTSSCCLVECFTCGRESSGEIWRASRIRSNVQVYIQDKLVLLENLDLQASMCGSLPEKIGGCVVFGTVIIVGPRTSQLRSTLQVLKQRQSFSNHKSAVERKLQDDSGGKQEVHVDPLVSLADIPGGSVLRFSAVTVEDCYCLLALIFSPLEKELNISPSPYMERIVPSSLAQRVAQHGSIFHALATALSAGTV